MADFFSFSLYLAKTENRAHNLELKKKIKIVRYDTVNPFPGIVCIVQIAQLIYENPKR
jgi:hypothetical protein